MHQKFPYFMKRILFKILDTASHIALMVKLSKSLYQYGAVGRLLSRLLDKFIRVWYGMELSSFSIDVQKLLVGHSVGVVLGGNGIKVNGILRVSSGVVFGRKHIPNINELSSEADPEFFFCNGDLTVGANAVVLGPIRIEGPTTIGAGSLVTKDITIPGIYAGNPLRKIK